MIYKTGERTLTLKGNLTSIMKVDQQLSGPGAHFYFGWGRMAVSGLFAQIYTHDTDIGYGVWHHQMTVIAGTGLTNTHGTTSSQSASYTLSTPQNIDLSGTYTITVDLEQLVEITIDTWNGFEAPQRTKTRFFERLKVGGYVTVTATSGTCSASDSCLIAAGDVSAGISYAVVQRCEIVQNTGFTISAATTAKMGFGTTYVDLTAPYSRSVVGHSCDCGAGCSVTSSGVVSSTNTTICEATIYAPKAYDMQIAVRSWADAYPGTLGFKLDRFLVNKDGVSGMGQRLDISGGSGHDSYSQQRYTCTSTLGLIPQSQLIVDEWTTWIELTARPGAAGDKDHASLLALGEDVRDIRALMRGWPYNSVSIAQASTTTVDDCSSLTPTATPYAGSWAIISHCTLSLASGIRAVVSGGTGSFRRNFTGRDAGLGGYRYLKIAITADTESPFGITIGSKQWTLDAFGHALKAKTTAGSYVVIDLCGPQNQTADTDDDDSRWKLPASDGPYWGVTAASAMDFTGLTSGVTYTVASMALTRAVDDYVNKAHSEMTILGAFDDWQLEYDPVTIGDTTTSTYVRRFLDGDTDGKRSLEMTDVVKTVTTTGGGDSVVYTQVPISGLFLTAGGAGNPSYEPNPVFAGWSITDIAGTAADPSDYSGISGWLTNNRPATYLFGAGAIRSGAAWTYGVGVSYDSSHTAKAQVLIDAIQWYPLIGDVFQIEGVSGAGPLYLAACYFCRGQGHGLVYNSSRIAVKDQLVGVAETSPTAEAGSASTTLQGEYLSVLPYGRGLKTVVVSTPASSVSRTWKNRVRRRAVLTVKGGGWISYDVSVSNRHHRAYTDSGLIKIGQETDTVPTTPTWSDIDTGITGDHPCIRIERQTKKQALYLAYDTGGSCYLQKSTDEGRNWVMAVTVGTGTYPAFVITKDGRKLIFYIVGTAIKGKWYDALDNEIVSEFTAVASGVDADAIAVDEYTTASGKWRISLLYRSSGQVITKTSTDGKVFT